MAKDKTKGGPRHIHARLAYLQRAATYLTTTAAKSHTNAREQMRPDLPGEERHLTDGIRDAAPVSGPSGIAGTERAEPTPADQHASTGLPPYLTNHLMQVCRKMQVRLPSDVKHAICKRCGAVLLDSETSRKFTENLSTGGQKRHAEVTILECAYCGAQKRFPAGAMRQKKKALRESAKQAQEADGSKKAPS